jgi:endo-1,4-beta-xylanase
VLEAQYQVSSSWGDGYVASIVIRNNDSAAKAWRIEIRLPAGATVTRTWNANFQTDQTTQNGQPIILITPAHSPTLGVGATITVGYQVGRDGTNNQPTFCAVNGSSCH